MAIPQKIKNLANKVRTAVYGKEVRESLAESMEETASVADETKTRQDSLETQFQDVLDETTGKDIISAPEILAARGSHANLKQRLDSEYQEVTTQLEQKASIADVNLIDVDYGEITLPSDFPHTLPFAITAIDDNKIEHDFDITEYKTGAGAVYLDDRNGSSSNDGLTPQTPLRHMDQAITVANGMTEESVIIYIMSDYYTRNYSQLSGDTVTLTKNLIFSPYDKDHTFIGSFEEPSLLTWTADGVAYKTTRSATKHVLDLAFKFKGNEPTKYKEVASVAEVQAEQGTWYTDGSSVWVRRYDDKVPDSDLMVMMDINLPNFVINGKKLVFDRVSWFWYYDHTPSDGLKVTGDENSELVLYKSSVAYAHLNGLSAIKVGKVFNVESLAYDNGADGFNYHGTLVSNPYEFVYEYKTESFDNGKNGLGNNNSSTAHEGMSILRIGTLTYRSDGPVIADVNGCYSILINCVSHTSNKSGAISKLKSAFYFSDGSGVKPGKVLLINCGGGGKNTYALGTDGVIKLQVRRFKGKSLSPEAESTVEFV